MTDLFGYAPPRPAFIDIRNQRDSVAEEKARLCLALGVLCRTVPDSIKTADIKETRRWVSDLERAKKTLSNKRSSVNQLTSAVNQMRSY